MSKQTNIAPTQAFLDAFLYWFVLVSLFAISVWSFMQTWQFTNNGAEPRVPQDLSHISFWLAVFIQYMQNVFLFWAFLSKGRTYDITPKLKINVRYMCMIGWLVFSIVDAGTNINQWRSDNLATADNPDLWLYTWTWYGICAGCIFVEEFFIKLAVTALHKTNEFFVSIGTEGIDAFWSEELMDETVRRYGKSREMDDFPNYSGNSSPIETNSFNPSSRHEEELKRKWGGQGQQNQGKGKKKKGTWKPGGAGRPPNSIKNRMPPEIESKMAKLFGQKVKDE